MAVAGHHHPGLPCPWQHRHRDPRRRHRSGSQPDRRRRRHRRRGRRRPRRRCRHRRPMRRRRPPQAARAATADRPSRHFHLRLLPCVIVGLPVDWRCNPSLIDFLDADRTNFGPDDADRRSREPVHTQPEDDPVLRGHRRPPARRADRCGSPHLRRRRRRAAPVCPNRAAFRLQPRRDTRDSRLP